MRGYRGFLGELSRTRSRSALWLQLRGGLRHLLRSWWAPPGSDQEASFVRNYTPDGFAIPDAAERVLAAAAQRCLACGLCSAECARVGGAPAIDPQEGVLATSRLRSEALRFGLRLEPTAPCGSCRSCEGGCPVQIPIASVLDGIAFPPERNRAGSS